MATASRIVLALALFALTLGGSLSPNPADGAADELARAVFHVV